MKYLKLLLLFLLINTALTANYIVDINNLSSIITPFLKTNKSIKALVINDSKTNKIIFKVYKEEDNLIFQKEIPEKIKNLKQSTSTILDNLNANRMIMTLYIQHNKSIQYTKDEKKWLSKNPVSRIAVMDYWPHDNDGNSLHTELLKLINKYAGTNIIPIKFHQWSDGFTQATTQNGVAGIMGLSKTKERMDKYFFFTPAYDFTPCFLIVKKIIMILNHLVT